MLGGKDTEYILKIHHGASLLKPILHQLLEYTQQNNNSNNLENISYQNWNVTSGNLMNRIVPKWASLDRLSVGLIFREIGRSLFSPVLILAYCELILEDILSNHQNNASSNNSHNGINYNELITQLKNEIEEFTSENRDNLEQKGEFDEKNLHSLLRKYEKLNEIFLYGINQLNLLDEFTKNPKFNGHDLKQVLLFFSLLSSFILCFIFDYFYFIF